MGLYISKAFLGRFIFGGPIFGGGGGEGAMGDYTRAKK